MRIGYGLLTFLAFASIVLCAPAKVHATGETHYVRDGQEAKDEEEKVYEVGNGVSAPRATYAPQPSYTDKARRAKTSGTIVLQLIVTPEGTARGVHVIKSLTSDLDKQAVSTVQTWKFEPAKKDGKPVPVQIKVEVSFQIR